MTQLSTSRVVITGAASGIGRRMVLELARKGARISAWDINEVGLRDLSQEVLASSGAELHTAVVDVGDRVRVEEAALEAIEALGVPNLLINNAGIVSGKTLLETTPEEIERSFRVNTFALFWTTRALLPAMIREGDGHVVNVASAAGHVGVAGLADYCASKFAAVGFDEALRMEMGKQGHNIRTTVVCPYYIDTGMFDGVQTRFPSLLPILGEEYATGRILRAIERNDARLLMPWLLYIVPVMRLLPVKVLDALASFLGINQSMDHFVGRAREVAREAARKSREVTSRSA